jgi:glycerol uptake facilitator-like aquaporin
MAVSLSKAYVVELVGTFGLVFFSAGVVCVNYLALPTSNQPPGTTPLYQNQPGALGIALAQGLIFAVLLALTVPVSGGYLNPAITVTLWAFNRLDSRRAAWLIGAQVIGAFLAGTAVRFTFDRDLLELARFGTPHLNIEAYRELRQATLYGGTGLELVLTFFLVFALFGAPEGKLAPWAGGAGLVAAVLVGFPITGAALNPARWLGTVLWESWLRTGQGRGPFDDVLVYLAGPILGSLLAGGFCFLFFVPRKPEKVEMTTPGKTRK